MSDKVLIVLFGHKSLDGQLSKDAKLRCDKAKELLDAKPHAFVLPTGAFGKNFNWTTKPHWAYLTDYLLEKGIHPDRILCGTASSETLEDCFCARKVALDNDFSIVIAVTAEYHMPRVQLIFERISRGLEFDYERANKPPDIDMPDAREEQCKIRSTLNEWVDVPLYEKGASIPLEIYENAGREQQHYDTMSMAVVSAIVAVSGYALSNPETSPSISKPFVLIAAAVLDFLLLIIYLRMAESARTARRVMRYIEVGFGARGFSANWRPGPSFNQCQKIYKWLQSIKLPSIKSAVVYATCLLVGVLLLSAAIALLQQ